MKKACTFYIVRHGETQWNVQGIIQGQSDSPLTKNGHNQAKETGKLLKNIKFDHVFSSDLLRAQKTAKIIALDLEMAVSTTHLLRERRFGWFQGKSYQEFRKKLGKQINIKDRLSKEERSKFRYEEGIETDEETMGRFITFLREIAVSYPGKKVLIVSHGGIMRTFLVHLGFAEYNDLPLGSVSNTGYIVLESDGIEFDIKKTFGIKKAK